MTVSLKNVFMPGRKRMVMIGCGAVGKALLETIPMTNVLDAFGEIIIIEPKDVGNHPVLKKFPLPVTFMQTSVTSRNLQRLMDQVVRKGDIIVDVSVHVEALSLIEWCAKNGCMYLNTSMESWKTDKDYVFNTSPSGIRSRTLYEQQQSLEKLRKKYPGSRTIVTDHGMNPGLISHFVKEGLVWAAEKSDWIGDQTRSMAKQALKAKNYARAARLLGLKVVHCSERDSQSLVDRRKPGAFLNTWSVVGFMAESLDPVQIGFGTHEKTSYIMPPKNLPQIQTFLPIRGMDLMSRSFVPDSGTGKGNIQGYCIPHGESYSLAKLLTDPGITSQTIQGERAQSMAYRPSIWYVYQCSPFADKALQEVRKTRYRHLKEERVLELPEISEGHDAVGALLMFEDHSGNKKIMWHGTILSRADVKKYGFKYAGPTVVQVAAGMLSALVWMMQNPRKGLVTSEDMDSACILKMARPFLGKVLCQFVNWTPPKDLQFASFLTKDLSQ